MGLKILYIYYQPFPLDYSEIMFLRYKMSTKKDVKKFEFNELEEKKLNKQIFSSIVTITIKFLNNLLKKNNNIINKSRNCLKKVYNTFLSKASNLCNIISKQNKEGQIKEMK